MKKCIQILMILGITAGFGWPSPNSQELIIGGHPVSAQNEIARFTVALLNERLGTLCTATILSAHIAVTAAHCVEGQPSDMLISFGAKPKVQEQRRVQEIATPAAWSHRQESEKDTGDIALVLFSGGLPEGTSSASLMNSNQQLSNGEIVTLAGFGISKANQNKGQGTLRSVEVKIADAHFSHSEVSLDQTEQKGACHGDSGGPAFIRADNGELLLWGVTSRGIEDPADLCNGQSVYTRIQFYTGWIERTIASWK
jgi:secreted trypsin-like serine protease